MRTNIVIDDELLAEAFKYTNVKTKKELVNIALEEFVEKHRKKNLQDLKGKISFILEYDYKKMREGIE